MGESLYRFLAKKQKKTAFDKGEEMSFFLDNRVILASIESYLPFLKAADPFSITRANIIIRGLLNKKIIEKLYNEKSKRRNGGDYLPLNDYMEMGMSDLPYLNYEGEKIFIPSFPLSINRIYSNDFAKLGKQPYAALLSKYEPLLIDPFDYFGYNIYDSYFTKLVKIAERGKIASFYDFDANRLYFVNDEGRLDVELCLFDKYLEKTVRTHLTKRLTLVSNAYFDGDKSALIASLLDNGFVSMRLLAEYAKKDSRK